MIKVNILDNHQIEKIYSPLKISTNDITQINFNDIKIKDMFETYKTYLTFEDSWFAVIQGIRHNPRLYKNKIFFCDHPYKNDSLVVYNHLCKNYLEFAEFLKNLLCITRKNHIVWKNANPDELEKLKPHGFRPYERGEFWNPLAKFDDQTYPQHLCLIENTRKFGTKSLSQLRQQARAVERNYKDISIESYQEKSKAACISLLKENSTHKNLFDCYDLSIAEEANLIYLNYPPPNSYVFKQGEKVIGFMGFDICGGVANFNCLIYDRNIKYLASYTMIKIFEILGKEGAIWVNLSGSENKTLDHWKKKFCPEKSILKTHMIFSLT